MVETQEHGKGLAECAKSYWVQCQFAVETPDGWVKP